MEEKRVPGIQEFCRRLLQAHVLVANNEAMWIKSKGLKERNPMLVSEESYGKIQNKRTILARQMCWVGDFVILSYYESTMSWIVINIVHCTTKVQTPHEIPQM